MRNFELILFSIWNDALILLIIIVESLILSQYNEFIYYSIIIILFSIFSMVRS